MADIGDIKDELDDINRSLEKLYDILYKINDSIKDLK